MAEPKTQPTSDSVDEFLNRISDVTRRADCFTVSRLMSEVTASEPKMWGTGIVGFGSYHFKYASGREGDWPLLAFSPRKQNLTLYLIGGFEAHKELMAKLGKHSVAKSCLYLTNLSEVHLPTLKKLMRASVKYVRQTYG